LSELLRRHPRRRLAVEVLSRLKINLAVNMTTVVIKILQGSAVTQTVLDELLIHHIVANFL